MEILIIVIIVIIIALISGQKAESKAKRQLRGEPDLEVKEKKIIKTSPKSAPVKTKSLKTSTQKKKERSEVEKEVKKYFDDL